MSNRKVNDPPPEAVALRLPAEPERLKAGRFLLDR